MAEPADGGPGGKYRDASTGVMASMEPMMKMIEIATRSRRPDLHPMTLSLDHLDFHRFRSYAEDQDDVVLLGTERDGDRVVVQVGCSSAEIARRLEDAWG